MEAPLRFQHFEVLTKPDGLPHVLGKGAMGVTYKAFDTNLHKIVVIKVISPRFLSDPTARQRFLNEAKAMAQIKHPNVADVFHFGETPTGVFYAMEYCHGPALEEYVRQRGSLKAGDALLLCKQVAGALQAIEQAALIHRDVKPSNLILTQDVQGAAQLKLIDFGLARPGTPDEHDPNLTQGGFVGTPNYASPEQLLEQEGLDIRTDIYSLGGTLWFLLTGEPVFRGSHVEVMFHHVNSAPPFERLPHLPESALAILKRMLAKAVDDRFATAGDLWNALDDCLRQENLAEPGSAPRLPNLDVREPSHGGILGRGHYEILGEGGQIRDGVLFQARDVLYGRLVALRYLKREIAGNSAMVRKLRAEAARLKSLPHANLISVLGFQEDEDGVKIVQEWVSGPALLDLLKARDHLPLNELAPMLAQLAAGLDHAIRHEMGSVETQVHQILIQVPEAPTEGSNRTWHGLLRRPLAEWGDFTVKVNPLGASLDWREEVGGVGRKVFREFLALAHRLLGGVFGSQTEAHDQYATVPHLRAEANEILERYLFESMPSSGTPCRQALAELLAAERVTYELPAAEAPAPPAAAPVPADETVVSSVVKPASWSAPASSSSTTEEYHAKRLELDRKRQALQAEEAQLEHQQRLEAERQVVAQERQLLEQQREDLRRREQERAQAADEERRRLEAERERLEKHAADLDEKRREQDRLAQELRLRSQLEFQKLQEDRSKLEDEWGKRREEQEHEARLVERAREFARLEEAQMARLAGLEREVAEAESKLSQERETVFTQERRHEAAVREASQEDEAVQERILMAQARLDEERAQIDRKILQLHQGQKTRLITIAAGVVLAVIGAGVTGWLVKARLLDPRDMPYQKAWNSFQEERDRARTAQDWSKLLGWCVSTNWAFTNPDGFQDPVRRAQYADFYRDKHAVVRKDAQESIDALVEIASKGPLPREVDRKSLLINLNVTKDWDISSKRDLLRALLILDDINPSNHAACLEAYRNAVTADASLMLPLQGRLNNAAEAAWDDFREDWNVDGAAQLLQAIDELSEPSRVAAPRLTLLKEAILAEKLREDGQKAEALEAVVEAGRTKPEWFADLAPARERIVNDLATQPFTTLQGGLRTLQREAIKTPAWSQEFSASILTLATAAAARPEVSPSDALTLLLDVNREFPSLSAALAPSVTDILKRIPDAATDQILALQNLLVAAGEAWKMPLPFMRLAAAIESKLRADPSLAGTLRQTLFDFYRRADGFGDADARAEVGGFYVGAGVNDQSADDIKKGLDLLAAADQAGSIRAPQILGEFYFSGMGVPADADQAVSWARKALEAGHPDARLLLGKSLLRKAELTKDAALYQESSQVLRQTVNTHLDAYNFLYVAMWNETVQQPAEAAQMLQAGAAKGVVGCEYFLGLWYANGNPPIEQNLSLAREWITKAAKDGHPEARNWCQQQGVKWE